ncbi:Small COPII coat GTPase SAR1 [Astathelohania contejeani]|uniref:Small COPII coat GTPase SAR1 n=1 Tax=Astathelohania contejeani TaxID=164912 RepID=A0ABQ7I1V3_9MICR|nr:Small COPII coat GTPase SAR1 [Thelohania contejeani]
MDLSYFIKIKEKLNEIYEWTVATFIRRLFKKPASILFLGIDNAGKTTLLNKLKNDTTSTFAPTHHPMATEIEIGNLTVKVVDMGGHTAARMAWKEYYQRCDGVVFVVDVNDSKRFGIVRETFEMVRGLEILNKTVKPPIAVFMNKIDLVGHNTQSAMNDPTFCDVLRRETGIYDEDDTYGQPVKVTYLSIKEESPTNLSGPLVSTFKWLELMISRNNMK